MTNKNLLLILIISAAVSFSNLFAAESAADFHSWAESRQIISLNSDYPEYSIIEPGALSGLPSRTFKPWTRQLRVAGFAVVDGGVVIAVNSGYPLVLTTGGSSSAVLSSPDPLTARRFLEYSSGLTTGTVFSEDGRAFFHIYRDDFFNPATSVEEESSGHPILLEFSKDKSGVYGITNHYYDFHEKNPGWEPVEYLRKAGESLVAWKYSDEKKTRFRYIRHGENGESIAEIDEGFFRDEYSLISIDSASFALRGFLRAARGGSAGPELSNAGDIYLRLASAPEELSEAGYPLYYYSPARKQFPGADRRLPVQLQACSDAELWYILEGDEVLVCGANISRWKLPPLPEGFVYRQLWVGGRDMIVSWEESRFPFIGRSGMMYIRLRDIIN